MHFEIIVDVCKIRQITGKVKYNRRSKIATLAFSVFDDIATTECSLDGDEFESCKLARTHAKMHIYEHNATVTQKYMYSIVTDSYTLLQ